MAKRVPKNSSDSAPPADAPRPGEPEAWTAARLAEQLGVTVEVVEQLQGSVCVPGKDFVDAAGVAVLTASGMEKIRARLREESPADQPAKPAPQRADLRITRVYRWSRNVLAETSAGLKVVLSVRSIAHVEAGMVLRDCIRGEMGWTYEGRLPRTIGERQLYFPPKPAASIK